MSRPVATRGEEHSAETGRLTAPEIFLNVVGDARRELKRSSKKLAFSGLAGGLTLGLTGLSVAAIRALLGRGGWQDLVSYLAYPIGFIAVVIGRAQLFTENTLYPVILVLDEHRYLLETLRLWLVVFAANILGAMLFGLLAIKSGALFPGVAEQLVTLGDESLIGSNSHIFWSARDCRLADRFDGMGSDCQPMDNWATGDGLVFDFCGWRGRIFPLCGPLWGNYFCRSGRGCDAGTISSVARARNLGEHRRWSGGCERFELRAGARNLRCALLGATGCASRLANQ